MKKTWIKIKRGLLEPKHRERLGIRIWLYVYILDNADWDTGQIREWRDKDAADEMQMPMRTLAQQRQQLAYDGYITCEVAGNKQIITIHNYTNPRRYDGEVANQKGTENNVGHAIPRAPYMGGTNEGTYEGTNKGLSKPRTPSYRSQITYHNKKEEKIGGVGFYIFNLVGLDYDKVDSKTKAAMLKKVDKYGENVLCNLADRVVEEYPNIVLADLFREIEKYSQYYDYEKPREAELQV